MVPEKVEFVVLDENTDAVPHTIMTIRGVNGYFRQKITDYRGFITFFLFPGRYKISGVGEEMEYHVGTTQRNG